MPPLFVLVLVALSITLKKNARGSYRVCIFHDYHIIIIAAQQARGAAASQKQQFS
jgi:hypothetical protein